MGTGGERNEYSIETERERTGYNEETKENSSKKEKKYTRRTLT